MSFPTDNPLLNLKTENTTLLHTLQLHLNLEELEELNILLFEFTESCLANRPNPELNNAVYYVKMEFNRLSK